MSSPRAVLVLAGVTAWLWLAPSGPAAASQEVPEVGAVEVDDAGAGESVEVGTGLVPDDGRGRFPASQYDIGYDSGAWNHLDRKFFGTLTQLAFGVGRWLVGLGLWIVPWAYRFGIADALGDPALRIANVYEAQLVGPLELRHLAWFWALAWAGYQGLRGRLPMAASEMGVSALVAVLGSMVLANPAGYLSGTLDTTQRLSSTFLLLGTGAEGERIDDPGEALAPLSTHIHAAFVEQPYDLINWGRPLSGACATVRDEILADGPHGSSDDPRKRMRAAGCNAEADYNKDPTADRLGAATLSAFATATVVVLLVMVAVTLLVAQVVAVLLFAVAPFALVSGLVPGAGRELLWRWLAALARVVLLVVGMSFVLSLLLLVVDGLLGVTGEASVLERFTLLVLVSVAMFVVRKRLVHAGGRLAERMSARLSASRTGAARGSGWLAPSAVGGMSGYALGASMRDAAGEVPGGWHLQYLGTGHPRFNTRALRAARRRGRPTLAPSHRRQGLGVALGEAARRAGQSRPGRVAGVTARTAVGAAGLAYKSTLGLPVHGPRAYRALNQQASSAGLRVRAQLRAYRREYAHNLGRLRRPEPPPDP